MRFTKINSKNMKLNDASKVSKTYTRQIAPDEIGRNRTDNNIKTDTQSERKAKEDWCDMVILQYWPILFVVAFIGLIIKMAVDSKKLDKAGDAYDAWYCLSSNNGMFSTICYRSTNFYVCITKDHCSFLHTRYS